MSDSKVVDIGVDKKFPLEGQLMGDLNDLLDKYAGKLSLVSVIGVLEMKKDYLCRGGDND